MTLDEIGLKHGTDQASNFHDYLSRLEWYFAPMRKHAPGIIEAGVDGGASIRTWAEYFPEAYIVGIDHNPKCWQPDVSDKRVAVLNNLDATDPGTWALAVRTLQALSEDRVLMPHVIIDDASHHATQTIKTFDIAFGLLAHEGIYVVQDLHTQFTAEYTNSYRSNSLDFIAKTLLPGMMELGQGQCGKRMSSPIDYIHFSKSLAVIGKA